MASALRPSIVFAVLFVVSCALATVGGVAAESDAPLALESAIPLPDVRGRIDHITADLKRKRLIVAELGNNTADVVDLSSSHVIHRVDGLSEPQGVGYSARADLILIANAGDGSLRLFTGENFIPAGSIELGDDADNVRINPRNGLVVVGFGTGGLALIDPAVRAKVAQIPLSAHPEGFQIDPQTDRAFVNIPNAGQIAAVDLKTRRLVVSWRTDGLRDNFPIALQPASVLLVIAFRRPPVLALVNRNTGDLSQRMTTCGDADDVFFDERRQRIYLSCGSGTIDAFQIESARIRPLHSTNTAPGARTSLFLPELDRLFIARPAGLTGSAAILVYRPVP